MKKIQILITLFINNFKNKKNRWINFEVIKNIFIHNI